MTDRNSYCSLSDFKNVMGISATTDDVSMLNALEASTRMIEEYTGRHFYSESATKYFDGATTLWIPDLLSITASGLQTDEDGDRTFENTFSSTDYIEYGRGNDDPLNSFPIVRLEIAESASYGTFAQGVKKGVKIAGTWGFGDGFSSAPYISDTTLSASVGTGTTASVTSATNLHTGMTILFDSEQAYITATSDTTLTLERGVNGTTPAAHANATQIYYYRYPRDVVQACMDLTSALWQNRARKGITSEGIGDYRYTLDKSSSENILKDSLWGYRKVRV